MIIELTFPENCKRKKLASSLLLLSTNGMTKKNTKKEICCHGY